MATLGAIFFLLIANSLTIRAHQSVSNGGSFQRQQDLNGIKKCVPLFGRNALTSSQQQQQQNLHHHGGQLSNLSFLVADIDLPLVVPAEGSIQSAMRLLSTFSSQFDQIMAGDQDDGDDERDDDDDATADMGENNHGNEKQQHANVIKFRENKLHLSGLNLSMLSVHLYADGENETDGRVKEPKFGIGITIKNTTLDGRFIYKGPLAPLTSAAGSNSLKGYYSMSIDNIYLLVSSNLSKVSVIEQADDRQQQQQPLPNQTRQRLVTNEFTLNVTNLGYISIDIYDSKVDTSSSLSSGRQPTSNYLLKMLQKVLQRTIKRTYLTFEQHIRQALELEGRRALDCELTRFDDLLSLAAVAQNSSSSAATSTQQQQQQQQRQRGDLARLIDREIVQSGFSRVELPNFEHQQSVLGSVARISFYNGSLSGLNTIKMIGETRIKLQDQHLIMNTSLGWLELRPYYSWNLTLGAGGSTPRAPTSQGFVSFQIRDFDFDAVVTKGLQDESASQESVAKTTQSAAAVAATTTTRKGIVVEQLIIRHLDTPKMDIGGLPGMNRLTRAMVNFFMGRLKQRLTSAIQPVLKQQLERSLNKLPL